MKILCNYHALSSAHIDIVPFGRSMDAGMEYDYSTPFPDLVRAARDKHGVEAVFIFYPEYNAIPPEIEESDLPLYAFVSDWNLGYFPLCRNLERFDHIVTDKKGVELFRSLGYKSVFQWNMYGYIPAAYESIGPVKREWDVVFIGNVNPSVQKERSHYLKRLLALSDRLKIRVETNVHGKAYVEALKSAKVVFNRSIRGEANMRVFEALAAETLIFLESSNEEIRDLFEEGKECALYQDEEFEERLIYYATHDGEREEIVRNASRKKEAFSYPAMMERLYEKIQELTPAGKPR